MSSIFMMILFISVTQTAPAGQTASASRTAQARCDLYVIGASMKKAPVPLKLKRFASLFKKMPFKMYRGYRLVNTWNVPLSVGRGREYAFTAKDSVRLTLKGLEQDKRGKIWLKLKFEILRKTSTRAKRKSYDMLLRILAGKPMFVAGPEVKGETLFIGVICK